MKIIIYTKSRFLTLLVFKTYMKVCLRSIICKAKSLTYDMYQIKNNLFFK